MKDFLIKSTILFWVALFESAVGLPILLSGLFLFWLEFGSERQRASWVVWVGILFGIFWNLSLWVSVLAIFVLSLLFLVTQGEFLGKALRVILWAVFFGWLFFMLKDFDFNFRFPTYSILSIGILSFLQRAFREKFEKKYL